MDMNYWLTATHHTQVSEGTTIVPGPDGQNNIGEVQEDEPTSGIGGGGGIFALCCGLPIALIFVRRRRRRTAAQRLGVAVQEGVANALAGQQPMPAMNASSGTQLRPHLPHLPLLLRLLYRITLDYREEANTSHHLQAGRVCCEW